jgi:HlyD family secretion protein
MTKLIYAVILTLLAYSPASAVAFDDKPADKDQSSVAKPDSGDKQTSEKVKQESKDKKDTQETSDSKAKESDAKEDKKQEKKELKLSGVLEAETVHEIVIRPETWSSFKVDEAVPHGTRVQADEILLQIETKDIDRKIEDSRRDLYKSKLSLQLAEQELKFAKDTFPIERELTESALENAKQDLEYFLEVTLPESKESAKRSLQRSQYSLEYNQEELTQLEKMYRQDDLTEETEEIILKRTRRSVEESQYSLERAEERTKRMLEIELPRREQQQKASTQKTILETEKALASQDINLRRRQHDFEQQLIGLEREEENLEKLLKDRNMMTIKSPAAGIVYYGQHTRGKWTAISTLDKQLRKGGSVTPNAVMMSVVDPGAMFVRVDISESELKDVSPGTKGVVTPKAFPDLKLKAEVTEVSLVPIADGKFDGKVMLRVDQLPERLVPGMGCEFIVPLSQDDEKEKKTP